MTIRLFANGKLVPEANYKLELARPEEKGYRVIYHEESGFDRNQVLELVELPDTQPKITRVMLEPMFPDSYLLVGTKVRTLQRMGRFPWCALKIGAEWGVTGIVADYKKDHYGELYKVHHDISGGAWYERGEIKPIKD